jgi:putative GTP pyrophosphokinase
VTDDKNIVAPFNFEEHRHQAISAYFNVRPFYDNLAEVIGRLIQECLKKRDIKVHSVQHRAKEPSSFGDKAAVPSEADPNAPKYMEPLKQITDLARVRIITYFPATVEDVDSLIQDEFEVVERSDKAEELIEDERFGYQSVHFLVRLNAKRSGLSEYERFAGATTEVQVRTILQHAWAEIEHDINYKSATAIPVEIRRRFMALAGMLEIADREFQAVQSEDRKLADQSISKVRDGDLVGVEITPDTIKLYLDKKLGPDDRISEWSYDWTARLLKSLGFRDLMQIEVAISGYDDTNLSFIATARRQGQIERFELMLLAALGELFIERPPFTGKSWFEDRRRDYLAKFREKGFKTSTYQVALIRPM